MSHTTFSNMSNPDLLITIQAYAYMACQIKDRMEFIKNIKVLDDLFIAEADILQIKLTRVTELSEALVNEYDKRENS
jgi:hypothetical protein